MNIAAALALTACDKPAPSLESKLAPVQVEQKAEIPEWDKYLLKDYREYNALLPTIFQESKRTGVPLEYLAIISLTESTGKGGQRFEPKFKQKYVDPNIDKFLPVFDELSKNDSSLSLDVFRKQLATSTGPFQIMYLTAVELGFRGSFEELSNPRVNAKWAAEYLRKKGVSSATSLKSALTIYNTGSPNGKPHAGYLDRAMAYRDMFSEEHRDLFPVEGN